ncbi:MAG: hypothetical protein WDW38_006471 [Sanguina aurantia]
MPVTRVEDADEPARRRCRALRRPGAAPRRRRQRLDRDSGGDALVDARARRRRCCCISAGAMVTSSRSLVGRFQLGRGCATELKSAACVGNKNAAMQRWRARRHATASGAAGEVAPGRRRGAVGRCIRSWWATMRAVGRVNGGQLAWRRDFNDSRMQQGSGPRSRRRDTGVETERRRPSRRPARAQRRALRTRRARDASDLFEHVLRRKNAPDGDVRPRNSAAARLRRAARRTWAKPDALRARSPAPAMHAALRQRAAEQCADDAHHADGARERHPLQAKPVASFGWRDRAARWRRMPLPVSRPAFLVSMTRRQRADAANDRIAARCAARARIAIAPRSAGDQRLAASDAAGRLGGRPAMAISVAGKPVPTIVGLNGRRCAPSIAGTARVAHRSVPRRRAWRA